MFSGILFWTSTWPQDHILFIQCVNLLSLSFILWVFVFLDPRSLAPKILQEQIYE